MGGCGDCRRRPGVYRMHDDHAQQPGGGGRPAQRINAGADATLSKLYTASPQAKDLVQRARGVLVFPSVMGASFIVGGEHGKACCARAARMRATTAPPAVRWDCRRGTVARLRAVVHDR